MGTFSDRLKEIRRENNLTQQEFADRIGIKRGTVANYELGRNEPLDAVISLICKEFGVSEDWLRYGEGEMFTAMDRDEEIAAMVAKVISGNNDFQKALVRIISSCTEKELEVLERKFRELAQSLEKEKGQT
jgi:transcriptional regulator with XRE-family HTH domain